MPARITRCKCILTLQWKIECTQMKNGNSTGALDGRYKVYCVHSRRHSNCVTCVLTAYSEYGVLILMQLKKKLIQGYGFTGALHCVSQLPTVGSRILSFAYVPIAIFVLIYSNFLGEKCIYIRVVPIKQPQSELNGFFAIFLKTDSNWRYIVYSIYYIRK